MEVIAGALTWLGLRAGRWFGIVVSCVAIYGAIEAWDSHPIFASLVIVAYLVVIYGLAVYGPRGSIVG